MRVSEPLHCSCQSLNIHAHTVSHIVYSPEMEMKVQIRKQTTRQDKTRVTFGKLIIHYMDSKILNLKLQNNKKTLNTSSSWWLRDGNFSYTNSNLFSLIKKKKLHKLNQNKPYVVCSLIKIWFSHVRKKTYFLTLKVIIMRENLKWDIMRY